MKKIQNTFARTGAALTVALAAVGLVACTTTLPNDRATPSEQRAQIDNAADTTLKRLYQTVPGSQEVVQRAQGMLIFPEVVSGGFIVGAVCYVLTVRTSAITPLRRALLACRLVRSRVQS